MTRGLFPENRLAVAIGRFNPHGTHGYRAATMPDAPLRPTRDAAEHDELTWLHVGADECAGDAGGEWAADLRMDGDTDFNHQSHTERHDA